MILENKDAHEVFKKVIEPKLNIRSQNLLLLYIGPSGLFKTTECLGGPVTVNEITKMHKGHIDFIY